MNLFTEVDNICVVKKGPNHGPLPYPKNGKMVKNLKEIVDYFRFDTRYRLVRSSTRLLVNDLNV